MRYFPHTDEDIAAMLKLVGVGTLEDLFSTIPEDCRRKKALSLPEAMTEWDLNRHMRALSLDMAAYPEYKVYLGAGSYEHYIPAAVSYLLERSEFSTAYTPYQPEISQGTLQAMYEYQTLVARLLGMDVANASMYDGASALAEAFKMSFNIKRKRKTLAISGVVNPLYRSVVETYFAPTEYRVVELPYLQNGTTDLSGIAEIDELAAVAVQSPNFFGCLEDLQSAGEAAHLKDALLIACFTEPLAYGLLRNPGSQGPDIACGEGQSLGIPQSFGGPGLGMFAVKKDYVRKMPGRLVGRTKDLDGKDGFVLTLATREQHIRREKATSNICSNQGLCALTAAMYMASVGGKGIRDLAGLNRDKAEYLKERLREAGVKMAFETPTFNEFVVQFPKGLEAKYEELLGKKIVAGLPLVPYYPELAHHYLLCVTETKTRDDLDALVAEITS